MFSSDFVPLLEFYNQMIAPLFSLYFALVEFTLFECTYIYRPGYQDVTDEF